MGRLALALLLAASLGAAAQDRTQTDDGWWETDAGLLHRIAAPKKSKSRPGLILLLHGKDGKVEPLEAEFKDAGVKAGFMVATVRSTASSDPDGKSKAWSRQDVPKLSALAREMMLAYRLDRARMYVVAMSPDNPGGDAVFRPKSLFTGYVTIAGCPRGFMRPLTPTEKMEMGVYFIVGSDDKYKRDTERERDRVKREGLRDVVLKEYPGVGAVVPEGCGADAVKWIATDRRKYAPGTTTDLPWVTGKSVFPRMNMIFAYSNNPKLRDACQAVEWDWFGDPEMIKRAQAMDCIRFELEKDAAKAKELGIREPAVVFSHPESGVKLRITARQVLKQLQSAARAKDPYEGYAKFRAAMNKQLDAALK